VLRHSEHCYTLIVRDCRDEKLDKEVEYVPELAAVWRGIEIPANPDELERELGKAGISAAPRTTERKRTALPPKVQGFRVQRITAGSLPCKLLICGAMVC
jgi:hypothetical protein